MSLIELAERVEKATGPNRELDAEIQHVLGLQGTYLADHMGWDDVGHAIFRAGPERYSASIDAAMSLVPEEMRDEIEITTLYKVARVGINLNHGPDGSPFYGSNESNSIPLAICAAALRARAQQTGER